MRAGKTGVLLKGVGIPRTAAFTQETVHVGTEDGAVARIDLANGSTSALLFLATLIRDRGLAPVSEHRSLCAAQHGARSSLRATSLSASLFSPPPSSLSLFSASTPLRSPPPTAPSYGSALPQGFPPHPLSIALFPPSTPSSLQSAPTSSSCSPGPLSCFVPLLMAPPNGVTTPPLC